MKENKFRAWDIKNKLYIYLIGYIIDNNTIRLWWKHTARGHILNESFPIDQIVIEQYTPIKDIYEGDKVYIAGLGDCAIIFDGLTFEAVTPKGDIVELRDCLEDIEKVIGNIHEEKS